LEVVKQQTPIKKACQNNYMDIVQWLILQGTPSKSNVSTWFNSLNGENKTILFQQGIVNRDINHESFLSFASIVRGGTSETPRDLRRRSRRRLQRTAGVYLLEIELILDKIHCYVCGISETRSLWYHIVKEGPGG